MYLKLTLRNAKRSLKEYIIYTVSLSVMIAFIHLSNLFTTLSGIAGLNGTSLPLLITIIITILLNYLNNFYLLQRSKELSTYTLLGMEKRAIALLVFAELFLLGCVCFGLGTVLGEGLFQLSRLFGAQLPTYSIAIAPVIGQTAVYFFLIEILSLFLIYRQIRTSQIRQMLQSERKSRNKKHPYPFWRTAFTVSFSLCIGLFFLAVFTFSTLGQGIISIISIPLLASIYCFYNMLFAKFEKVRDAKNNRLYKHNLLVQLAFLMDKKKNNAALNIILCICLLSASACFVFSRFVQQGGFAGFPVLQQKYMAFLQLCLSLIFIFLYFCVLALIQIIDSYKIKESYQVMYQLGKNRKEILKMLFAQISIRFLLPFVFYLMLIVPILLALFIGPVSSGLLGLISGAFIFFIVSFAVVCGVFLAATFMMNIKFVRFKRRTL